MTFLKQFIRSFFQRHQSKNLEYFLAIFHQVCLATPFYGFPLLINIQNPLEGIPVMQQEACISVLSSVTQGRDHIDR